MPYNNVAEKWTQERSLRDRLFCDLADATPTEGEIRLRNLTWYIPCIAHYAPKSQLEILRALMQKMSSSAWIGDRLARVRGGVYQWPFHDWCKDSGASSLPLHRTGTPPDGLGD
jgi:hypothetical protein